MKILGEIRDGVAVVLDTETGEARLAYRRPIRRKVSLFKSFLEGFASAFDFSGGSSLPNYSRGFERDAEALAGDWWRVGDNLRAAMGQIDVEIINGQRK